jgi:membrane-associated protease RseP (regulator of RpoE activity)
MSEFSQAIQVIAVYAIPVLFAISLHEAAHGYVARYFGDPTAHEMGRLSVNPTRHIDPFGTIILPLMLYLTIQMPFGYAKPVPVDYSRLRNPKKQMGFVAAAGPMANFLMGLVWMVWLVLLQGMGIAEPFLLHMALAGINVNAIMCVFNLLPVPLCPHRTVHAVDLPRLAGGLVFPAVDAAAVGDGRLVQDTAAVAGLAAALPADSLMRDMLVDRLAAGIGGIECRSPLSAATGLRHTRVIQSYQVNK